MYICMLLAAGHDSSKLQLHVLTGRSRRIKLESYLVTKFELGLAVREAEHPKSIGTVPHKAIILYYIPLAVDPSH